MYLIGYKFEPKIMFGIVKNNKLGWSLFFEYLAAGPSYYPYNSWLEEYQSFLTEYNKSNSNNKLVLPYGLQIVQDYVSNSADIYIGYIKQSKKHILTDEEKSNVANYISELNLGIKEINSNSDTYDYCHLGNYSVDTNQIDFYELE
jgi:hypothetical protein